MPPALPSSKSNQFLIKHQPTRFVERVFKDLQYDPRITSDINKTELVTKKSSPEQAKLYRSWSRTFTQPTTQGPPLEFTSF